jgi:hypothetical protein
MRYAFLVPHLHGAYCNKHDLLERLRSNGHDVFSKLLDSMCSILLLIPDANAYGVQILTKVQNEACADIILHVSECATFIQTYFHESYGKCLST